MLSTPAETEGHAIAASATAIPSLPLTRNPLALWHLLSLDAPTVAVVWLLFATRVYRVPVPPALPPAMFLAVWLIYVFDRLLDSRLPHPVDSCHHLHHTCRAAFTLAATFALALLTLLLPAIPISLLAPYLALAAILFAWLLLIHFTRLPMPKRYAPGFFFAAAVFIPALQREPLSSLLPPLLAFAALCTLNCHLIHSWERHSHPTPARALRLFAFILIASPVLLSSPIAVAVSLSATALLTLSRCRNRLHPTTLRAAADLALLTPLLFYVNRWLLA